MKKLETKRMKTLLTSGIRNIRRNRIRPPKEGNDIALFSKGLKNGWYYQVDYIHDSRVCKCPYVAVFAFRPPRVYWAKSAEYFLMKEID